jgi:hypothetical protein
MSSVRSILQIIILVGLTLSIFSNVYGDDWICIDRDDNGKCLFSYNKKIIRVSKNIVRVWEKKIISDEDKTSDNLYEEDDSHNVYLDEIDCKNKTMKLLHYTTYKISGSVRKTHDFSDTRPTLIVPDSRGELLYNHVCKSKTK